MRVEVDDVQVLEHRWSRPRTARASGAARVPARICWWCTVAPSRSSRRRMGLSASRWWGAGTCLGALGTSGPSGERWVLRAHGPTHVLVLAEAQFRSLVHHDPELSMKVITFLAHGLARPS